MSNKTESIEFVKNRWTEYMTTGDKEKFLKNLKKPMINIIWKINNMMMI